MSAARIWPVAVVLALVASAAANGVLLWAARDPAGSAAEPQAYALAVRWDSTLAARRASDSLGWTAHVAIGPARATGAEIEIAIEDARGRPVEGAVPHVTGIHNADASRRVLAELAPTAGGRSRAVLGFTRSGRWEIRLEARRGAERFFAILHAEAPGSAPR